MQLAHALVLVVDYDDAIRFYTGVLGFELVEDTLLASGKRWVRVRPPGSTAGLVLARATTDGQRARVGDQTGGRVLLIVEVDDLDATVRAWTARGARVVEPPRVESYGKVCVVADLYGNKLDVIEPVPVTGGSRV